MSLVNPLNQMMKLYKSSLAREKQAAAVSHRHTVTDRGSSVSFVLCPIMEREREREKSALTSLFCILILFPERTLSLKKNKKLWLACNKGLLIQFLILFTLPI